MVMLVNYYYQLCHIKSFAFVTNLVNFYIAIHCYLVSRREFGVKMPSLLCSRQLNISQSVVAQFFVSTVDASKAFDRICHVKLIDKISDRNNPSLLNLCAL